MWPDFTFAFQPIVNITNHSILTFEALVRGRDNTPALQILNQINKNDKYRFDELLRIRAVELAAKLNIDCNLNLNLLPHSLELSETAISSTLDMAKTVGFPLEKITLEIIESELINNPKWFAEAINNYRNLGLNIAIDDFGAGYSGLNLLTELQPDSLKLDIALIRNIEKHGPKQAIVRGVVRTSKDLGIDVIAEGVETEQEYLWCAEEGIELFQGYFFAKPGLEHLPMAFYPVLKK